MTISSGKMWRLETDRLLRFSAIILSIVLASTSLVLYSQVQLQDKVIISLKTVLEKQKGTIELLEINITDLKHNLSLTEISLNNETHTRQQLERELLDITMVTKSDYDVFAVDDMGKGHLIPLEVIIKNGKGNLFLNVANVLFDETLQSSTQTAVLVAREISRKNLFDKDILINIDAPALDQKISISGGSAGAAVTLSVMAVLQGRVLKNDVFITGTIKEDHTIGRIGEPRAKALVAKDNGAVMFLVPTGQKNEVGDVGIQVNEVNSIEDAARYAIQ